ncbi:acylneuraminate cytidylyltransferase family protein [Patescibacteria group bacterium]|nr:acylneuraminate cytidylyltransferase family protein [Patescibacteria group bacterium]MBU1889975.1 acylneuraminate cytidylyltransferase family protein [Patescibacteria group bacterium]
MKGHSERVPEKNIHDFAGKPLLFYILNTLSKSKFVNAIYVNTDSDKISETINKLFPKVKIIIRPEQSRGDHVSMNKVITYDISQINNGHFLQTHTTNPLLQTITVDNAIQKYFESLETNDSLMSVTRLQTRLYDHDGKPINHNPNKLLRTQDLNPVYEENSNLYIFSKESFCNNNNRVGKNPLLFEIDGLESTDIDTPNDFKIAEILMREKIVI